MLTLKSSICRVLRYFNCFGFCSFYFNLVWLSPFCMVGLWDQGFLVGNFNLVWISPFCMVGLCDQGFLVGIRVFPPESHVSVKKN